MRRRSGVPVRRLRTAHARVRSRRLSTGRHQQRADRNARSRRARAERTQRRDRSAPSRASRSCAHQALSPRWGIAFMRATRPLPADVPLLTDGRLKEVFRLEAQLVHAGYHVGGRQSRLAQDIIIRAHYRRLQRRSRVRICLRSGASRRHRQGREGAKRSRRPRGNSRIGSPTTSSRRAR